MSKKKKQQTSASGIYALCITAGLVVGVGLAPLTDNLPGSALFGVAAGAVAAFIINRRAPARDRKRHR